MDGFEVTRRVRQDARNQQLPIILVTALRETEDRVKGIEVGCDDFISKPVDKTELLARVRSLLKVKAFNDLTNSYQKKIEAEVIKRTVELYQTTINLQQEVTDRKLAEKKIAADREHLAITLRSIGDGVITTDIKGSIVMINKAAEFMTGWESGKALRRSVDEVVIIVNESTRNPCDNPVEIALRTNTDVEFKHNVYMISKDSSERLVTINTATLKDGEDHIVGCVLFFRDVTQKQNSTIPCSGLKNKNLLVF